MELRKGPFAAFDIGTNGIRMCIASVNKKGVLDIHYSDAFRHDLGLEMTEHAYLPPSKIKAVCDWICSKQQYIRDYEVKNCKLVATQVIRGSENGKEFVDTIKKETCWPVEVINHKQEVALSADGNIPYLSKNGNTLFVDIGGGSTEVALVDKNANIIEEHGFRFGAVTFSSKFSLSNKNPEPTLEEVEEIINDLTKRIKKGISTWEHNFEGANMLQAGCSVAVARYLEKVPNMHFGKVQGKEVKKSKVKKLLKELIELGKEGRKNSKYIDDRGVELTPPAAIIAIALCNALEKKSFSVTGTGVLRGLIISMAKGEKTVGQK